MQASSLGWYLHEQPAPLLKKENGVKSTIQTDPCDYKGHTHTKSRNGAPSFSREGEWEGGVGVR